MVWGFILRSSMRSGHMKIHDIFENSHGLWSKGKVGWCSPLISQRWKPNLVGGWTNPFEKYESKWESSPNRGENKKHLKPPTSKVQWDPHDWQVYLDDHAKGVFACSWIVHPIESNINFSTPFPSFIQTSYKARKKSTNNQFVLHHSITN